MYEVLTGDCDRDNNTLTAYFGGNGDIYIAISNTDENGIKTYHKVRIAATGKCPYADKCHIHARTIGKVGKRITQLTLF